MSIKVRSSLHSLVIIAVLIFSAVGPTIAYADGGTTTDTPPTETTNECAAADGTSSECPTEAPAVDAAATPEAVATEIATDVSESSDASVEATATEEQVAGGSEPSVEATALPATEEAAPATEEATAPTEAAAPATEVAAAPTTDPAASPTDAAATDAAAPATEVAAAPADASAPADTTLLNDVPANTTVQVVDANGQSQPLATQAAADAIATTSDPFWCPDGAAPVPGVGNCTPSAPSFTQLLNTLAANPTLYQGAGTIYVQQGAYTGGETSVNFNNYNLSNISSANLTITGGWNTPSNTVDPAGTSTFNNTSFVIGSATNPWGGALTINNLSISNTGGTGLTLYSQTDINLTNVNVTNSTNGAGAQLDAVGDVTIVNSNFTRNKTAGAIISHARNVTIRDSSFSNPANGRRQATGLDVTADGSVSLLNILADQNRNVGANINAGGFVTISGVNSFSGTKNIVGSSFFGYGLQVVTPDGIALEGVTANDNFLWGASLKAGGNVTIVKSVFNANSTASPGFIDDTGLLVTSGGNVTLDTVDASNNRLIGATINATGDVSINNSTFMNNNGVTLDSAGNPKYDGDGLRVVTQGSIFVNNVKASNNTQVGAHLEAGTDVTVSNSEFSNQTSGSATALTGRGLEVISGGFVILDHVTLNSNQTFGANVQAASAIFLDTVTATGNGTDGVKAQDNCTTLFLINGTYSNNGQYGLSIINMALDQTGLPVFATNGAGDIFQDPGTCIFTLSVPSVPVTPPVDNTGSGSTPPVDSTGSGSTPPVDSTGTSSTPIDSGTSGNSTGSTQIDLPLPVAVSASTVSAASGGGSFNNSVAIGSFTGASNNSGNVTLTSFLANARFVRGTHTSLFMGKYVYVYFKYGMQIFAYSPTPNHVAMVGPH